MIDDHNKKPISNARVTVVSQLPGKIFRWDKGVKITAIDMVIIALPKTLLQGNEVISTVISADDKMNVVIHPNSDKIFLYVQPKMSVALKKSAEAYIVANDDAPCRIQITKPSPGDGS